MVEILLKNGADPNIISNRGTPLMLAIDLDIARLLVEYGADVNARDKIDNKSVLSHIKDIQDRKLRKKLIDFLTERGAVQ
ncbi:MAG: hypothetical protein HC921_17555 [Synechococcaceae cyanobacterium SM2_3_1]|nr:hypothetical protein [Synechococcaceae cyanobacterium SM2_3_1]